MNIKQLLEAIMSRISAHYNELTESGRLEKDEYSPEAEASPELIAHIKQQKEVKHD